MTARIVAIPYECNYISTVGDKRDRTYTKSVNRK